jgi:hypothetical protein
MMVVKKRVVLFDLWCIVADTIVSNNDVCLSKVIDPSTNRVTITSSIIVLQHLTSVQVLRNKAVNDRRVKPICLNVISEFSHSSGEQLQQQ